MKKKIYLVMIITLVLSSISMGAYAKGLKEEIIALKDAGILISFNGEVIAMKDSDGDAVIPIMYNESTYLPVRAISDLAGLSVGWDGATQTVLLSNESKIDEVSTSVELPKVVEVPAAIDDEWSFAPELKPTEGYQCANVEIISHSVKTLGDELSIYKMEYSRSDDQEIVKLCDYIVLPKGSEADHAYQLSTSARVSINGNGNKPEHGVRVIRYNGEVLARELYSKTLQEITGPNVFEYSITNIAGESILK